MLNTGNTSLQRTVLSVNICVFTICQLCSQNPYNDLDQEGNIIIPILWMRKPGPREIKYSVQVTWLLNGRLRLDPSFVI